MSTTPAAPAVQSFWKVRFYRRCARCSRYQQPLWWIGAYNIIYQWLPPGDQAFDPTMDVDDNIPSFTDPTTGEVQTDISSGNVYVAWATGTVSGNQSLWHRLFQPEFDRDGHLDRWWAAIQRPEGLNTSGYGPTTERDAEPTITISQGTIAR